MLTKKFNNFLKKYEKLLILDDTRCARIGTYKDYHHRP